MPYFERDCLPDYNPAFMSDLMPDLMPDFKPDFKSDCRRYCHVDIAGDFIRNFHGYVERDWAML